LLALGTDFPETVRVNDSKHWTVPKWPFLLGDALLLALAYIIQRESPHPIDQTVIAAVTGCVALGAIIAVLPYILDYRVVGKSIEADALGSVAEKLQNLEKVAAQIKAATNEWVNAQTQAEKTAAGAKQVYEKMTEEVKRYGDFMQRMNEGEKAALRLEVEKSRRGEGEWLHVLVRILDHIHVLHTAAVHSDQPGVAEQIAKFQKACYDATRRIGLVPFTVAPGEPFDAERHQVIGTKGKPSADAVVAETAGVGFSYQGQLLRPALVKLQGTDPENIAENGNVPETKAQNELPLKETE